MNYRAKVFVWLKKYRLYEVEDLFLLSWRVQKNRQPNKREMSVIYRDLYGWEDHRYVPPYVCSYLRTRPKQ